eukprot:UC1_evm1s326
MGDDDLFKACREGHLNEAKALVAQPGFDRRIIDAPVEHFGGHTPLTAACWFGQLHVVKFLVGEAGASIERATTGEGQTPLHVASTHGQMEIIIYLVEDAGADVNAKDAYGDTPTRYADNMMKSDVVAYLQGKGGAM